MNRELRPGALGPASRLRRRYADAPAGAPRCARSAPAGARRRFPPASKSGLLVAFIFAGEATILRACRTVHLQNLRVRRFPGAPTTLFGRTKPNAKDSK